MNRFWKGILIASGILAFLLIMIWPMAPLWQRLGAKPKCIKGTWPDLRLTDCAVVEATVATIPLPTTGADGPIPLIVDDDGSPDGTIALLYFLRNPRFEVKAVTISNGEAHPEKFAPNVAKILAAFGRADIPVGYGKDRPLAGENAFPDAWRQASDDFWGLSLPQAESPFQPVPAAKLIDETILRSERQVTVFVSGSHTNLAEALRLEPNIAEKIGDVFIMGGGVNVPGNIHSDWPALKNETAEWNIWVDPQAAKEVFESGLRLHLIPLDATRQVGWRQTDIRAWESKSSPESGLAHDLGQWMLDNWSPEGVMIWDLVAALQATDQSLCPEVQMALEVVTTPGPEEGRTKTVNGPANMAVCLEPDPDLVKALAASVFKQP